MPGVQHGRDALADPCSPWHVAVPRATPLPTALVSHRPGRISELPWEILAWQSGCFPKQKPGPSGAEVPAARWELGMKRLESLSVPGLAWRCKHPLSPSRWLLSHSRSRQIPKGFPNK